jgi:hypothetical protein
MRLSKHHVLAGPNFDPQPSSQDMGLVCNMIFAPTNNKKR